MLDTVRVAGSLIMLADIGCKWTYVINSKFISIHVYNFYWLFLFLRMAFILVYHIYRASCGTIKLSQDVRLGFNKPAWTTTGRMIAQEREVEDPDQGNKLVCGVMDLFVQVFMLPCVMYAGFYRFITI